MRVEPQKSAARPRPAASPTCQLKPGHLQLYLGLGIATVAASIVAPTLTALTTKATAGRQTRQTVQVSESQKQGEGGLGEKLSFQG